MDLPREGVSSISERQRWRGPGLRSPGSKTKLGPASLHHVQSHTKAASGGGAGWGCRGQKDVTNGRHGAETPGPGGLPEPPTERGCRGVVRHAHPGSTGGGASLPLPEDAGLREGGGGAARDPAAVARGPAGVEAAIGPEAATAAGIARVAETPASTLLSPPSSCLPAAPSLHPRSATQRPTCR